MKLYSNKSSNRNTKEINISPLIDMVFILLIFFIVTTNFIKETVIKVNRPQSSTSKLVKNENILITIKENNNIYIENNKVDLFTVRAFVKKKITENPKSAVIIIADKNVKTFMLIKIMDQCRESGAKNINIACQKN